MPLEQAKSPDESKEGNDGRVLLLMCPGEAAPLLDALMRAGVPALVCRDAQTFRVALREGAGAVLMSDDTLSQGALELSNTALATQPERSVPLLWLTKSSNDNGAAAPTDAVVLEQPLSNAALVSVVRLALRAQAVSPADERVAERGDTPQATRDVAEQFGRAFYASPIPVAVTTLSEGRYVDINDSALALMGYERDEVVGRTAAELSNLEHMPEKRDELVARLREEGLVRDVPIKFRNRKGALREGLATFELIEPGGEPCVLSMVLDVTERRRDEGELMQAVQAVMSDTEWFSRTFIEKLAQIRSVGDPDAQAEIKELTPRERQVLERVAGGRTNAQIAAELNLSENTVRNYLASVFSKLNVHTRAEAVVWARKRGLGSRI